MSIALLRRFWLASFFFLISTAGLAPRLFAYDDWQPISSEELKMTAEPAAPGASAIVLYREESSDDNENERYSYYRIKILTDEGKKYADVKIPYDNQYFHVTDVKARTIHADGTIVLFDGKLLDGTLLKGRHVRVLEKTFSFPDVQVGSIIEYKYRLRWDRGTAFPHAGSFRKTYFRSARSSALPLISMKCWWVDSMGARLATQRLYPPARRSYINTTTTISRLQMCRLSSRKNTRRPRMK